MKCSKCGRRIASACERIQPDDSPLCYGCNRKAHDPVWQAIEKIEKRLDKLENSNATD